MNDDQRDSWVAIDESHRWQQVGVDMSAKSDSLGLLIKRWNDDGWVLEVVNPPIDLPPSPRAQ